ncbi:MAG TPA: 3-dehydroquinate synthase family protein, partial [Bacteroidia bacterium]
MNSAELIFTENISETFSDLCKRYQIDEPIVFCDSNTATFCLPRLKHPHIRSIVMPAGEINKNIEQCVELIQALEATGADRQSVLINLGGGVVSDLGGFAASIFQRGIRFINIPTTLLAMVDASIGGKTGVDFKDLKNYIGTFSQPEEILISTEFLDDNFPEQEMKSAWAEIIKAAVMFDAEL